MYKVDIHRNAEKALRKMPRHIQEQVQTAVHDLSRDPYCHGAEKLTAKGETYRIRLGDYRMIYELDVDARHILVTRLAPRGQRTYRWRR